LRPWVVFEDGRGGRGDTDYWSPVASEGRGARELASSVGLGLIWV